MSAVVLNFQFDNILAVKVYGLLADAGYYAEIDYWHLSGYTVTVAIKRKTWIFNLLR